MAQLALMIDLARCIGCGSCEAACKLEHHLGPDLGAGRGAARAGASRRKGRAQSRSLRARSLHHLSRARGDEVELMTTRVTGPGRRAGESVFKTAWRTVTGVEPVESFPYSA